MIDRRGRWHILVAVLLVVGGFGDRGLSQAQTGGTDDYVHAIETWRTDRDLRLRSPNGWLTIVALEWLTPGDNPFGARADLPVHLPGQYVPQFAGILTMSGAPGARTFTIRPSQDAQITLDDRQLPADEPTAIHSDRDGDASILALGRLRFWIVERGERAALRVRDPEAELRQSFRGVDSYPIDPHWNIRAHFTPFPDPQELIIPNILGDADTTRCYGTIEFEIAGTHRSLRPMSDSPEDSTLFVVFGDETNGKETYGGGRFLYARLEPNGSLDLDFNKAYNPPCAFNTFTTCPLPPDGNRLPIAVTAGEKAYEHGPVVSDPGR